MTYRLTALGFVALAAVASYAVLAGGDVAGLAEWLRRHGHLLYPTWLVWVVVAPLVLAAAGLVVRRSAPRGPGWSP